MHSLNPNNIVEAVCAYYGTNIRKVCATGKGGQHQAVRLMLIYLLRTHTTLSLAEIGDVVNRDHTTVMYQLKKYGAMIDDAKLIEDGLHCARTTPSTPQGFFHPTHYANGPFVYAPVPDVASPSAGDSPQSPDAAPRP